MSALTRLCYKKKSPRAARIFEVGLTPMLTPLLACQAHSSHTWNVFIFQGSFIDYKWSKIRKVFCFFHQIAIPSIPPLWPFFPPAYAPCFLSLFQTPNIYFPNSNLWNIGKDLGLPLSRQHCSSQPLSLSSALLRICSAWWGHAQTISVWDLVWYKPKQRGAKTLFTREMKIVGGMFPHIAPRTVCEGVSACGRVKDTLWRPHN